MDIESLYDYGDEEQDFYEESPGSRKGYPIDHRALKVCNLNQQRLLNKFFSIQSTIVSIQSFIRIECGSNKRIRGKIINSCYQACFHVVTD